LAEVVRLLIGKHNGPESIAMGNLGRIYGGTQEGDIIRLDPEGKNPELFAQTGGRPLGLAFDHNGNLIGADAPKGLLRINSEGTIFPILNEIKGIKITFLDDLTIGKDGTLYFTKASTRYTLQQAELAIVEHGGSGRLLAYNPQKNQLQILLEGLQFLNGVALSADESFLVLNETGNARVLRY
jgi:sugar lactone lactonase YvrE